MRNLGGSIGISILVATLAQNTQVIHSRLVEGLRPDDNHSQMEWTTEPEHELVVAHLDSFHSQVSGLHKACDTLLTIAEKIGLNPQPLPP
jgi:hypothetical protein